MISRRRFIIGASTMAFAGLAGCSLGKKQAFNLMQAAEGFEPLTSDPNLLLDLPAGFRYDIISKLGDPMTDGFHVPDRADGMGCLPLSDERVVLVRNHELHPKSLDKQPTSIQNHRTPLAYDSYNNGVALPGGTTSLIYNLKTKIVEKEFISLVGTIRNCSGGTTPWGSWLTCEESVMKAGDGLKEDHGYIFEVPATAEGIVAAKPLKEMGRFNHEAAVVDPDTGIVYLTEDRGDSLFYRFIPNVKGQLDKGGQLQAMVVSSKPKFDSRNWQQTNMKVGEWLSTEWIDLDDPESPNDDLRIRGYQLGAALFARGEGIHWADGELYFCCTNGGTKQLGQIMRFEPNNEGGRIQLFLESNDSSLYNFGDNLTVTPQGHLFVCEDQYTDVVDNHIRGVTPEGKVYNFAKLHAQTELAGACFSPDGSVLFVNLYSPTNTLAITGPWHQLLS